MDVRQGPGRARIPQTWAGKAAEEKLLYILSASCASPPQSGFLCFVSPYFVPREAAEEKIQSEKWKLWAGLSEIVHRKQCDFSVI